MNFSVDDLGTDTLLISVTIRYLDRTYPLLCNSNMAHILCNQILSKDRKEAQPLSSHLVLGKWQHTHFASFHNNTSSQKICNLT